MREIVRTRSFRRDVKKIKHQGKDLRLLVRLFDLFIAGDFLPAHYKDHALKGNWSGCRELHLAPDWLVIYHIEGNTVYLDRTGSHSELLSR